MEGKLQALKVVDLKKLLQDNLLSASGTKAELVKRLLENPSATGSLSGDDVEEDLIGDVTENTTAATPQAAQAAPVSSAPTAAALATTSDTAEEAPALTASTEPAPISELSEARKAEVIVELQKRKARAQKFGTSTEEIDAKLNRIERFGVEEEAGVSLQALDGELKPQKGRKEAKAEKRSGAPVAANGSASGAQKLAQGQQSTDKKAAPPPSPLDPVEEEKKRKRLERFGAPVAASSGSAEPADKKMKA